MDSAGPESHCAGQQRIQIAFKISRGSGVYGAIRNGTDYNQRTQFFLLILITAGLMRFRTKVLGGSHLEGCDLDQLPESAPRILLLRGG